MFDDADNVIELFSHFWRARHRSEPTINHVISTVGDERPFVCAESKRRLPADLLQTFRRSLPPKLRNFHWNRNQGSEPFYEFRFIGNDNHSCARRRDNFFSKQRTTVAFDQIERAEFHLIGAIHGQIDPLMFGKTRERNFRRARRSTASRRGA